MCGIKAAQKYEGGPAGPPIYFVRPLGRTFLYNLPSWIKICAQNRTRRLAVLRTNTSANLTNRVDKRTEK